MISTITVLDIKNFLGLDELEDSDSRFIQNLQKSAAKYISEYTGLSEKDLDKYNDLDIAYLVMIQDMYDNRSRYVDKTSLNQTVESILNLHSVNLL